MDRLNKYSILRKNEGSVIFSWIKFDMALDTFINLTALTCSFFSFLKNRKINHDRDTIFKGLVGHQHPTLEETSVISGSLGNPGLVLVSVNPCNYIKTKMKKTMFFNFRTFLKSLHETLLTVY